MRRPRIIVVVVLGALFLLLGTALVVMLAVRALPPKPLEIKFGYLTNNVSKTLSAVFTVSNPNRRGVWFLPMLPQIKVDGTWSEETIVSPAAPGVGLDGKSEGQFTIEVPTNGKAWRVPVIWVFVPTKLDWLREVGKQKWASLSNTGSLSGWDVGFEVPAQTNYTEQISRVAFETDTAEGDH